MSPGTKANYHTSKVSYTAQIATSNSPVHVNALSHRNRHKAIAAFQAALHDINSSAVLSQLGMGGVEQPATLSGPELRQTAAAAAALLASVRKQDTDTALQGKLLATTQPLKLAESS